LSNVTPIIMGVESFLRESKRVNSKNKSFELPHFRDEMRKSKEDTLFT